MTETRYAIRQETDAAARVTRLHLIGRLDRSARPGLLRALSGALTAQRRTTVHLDLAAVIFLGNECIDVLLGGYARALRSGHGYEVAGARGHVRRALAAVRLCAPGSVEELLDGPWWSDDEREEDDPRWISAVGDGHFSER